MDLDFNHNEDLNTQLRAKLRSVLEKIRLGGGEKRLEKLHAKGKFSARERIEKLIDKNTAFMELGTLAGYHMYEDHGGCPAGGVVAGIGTIHKIPVMIVANDATVKAGAWFPITAKKNVRAQEIAMENNIPIIYLVDSAGVYLPLQNEVFPDKEDFGRIFRNNAKMSAMGVPQIAAVMGSCVAGGGYLPVMSDESLIVEGTGTLFLAGSYLVKAAIGETVDNETLGGAHTHTAISGVIDHKCKDEDTCLEKIRDLIKGWNLRPQFAFQRHEVQTPQREAKDLFGLLPADRTKPYDVMNILDCIIDADTFESYKEEYGKTMICGYARIDGWSVGIVANQRLVSKSAQGEMQMGGVIYGDAADKAARFVMLCNQKDVPLLFIQDVSGFMVGSKAEHGGIVKDGAKLVNAMSNSKVPKFTLITANSFGAGNYAMCGRAYDPRMIFAWPTAQIGVMSGASAAKTLLQIQLSAMGDKAKSLSEDQKKEMMREIEEKYKEELSPYYAGARLWVDEVIDPIETRNWISKGIEMASFRPSGKASLENGVFQV